jgi:hypothetical protein
MKVRGLHQRPEKGKENDLEVVTLMVERPGGEEKDQRKDEKGKDQGGDGKKTPATSESESVPTIPPADPVRERLRREWPDRSLPAGTLPVVPPANPTKDPAPKL